MFPNCIDRLGHQKRETKQEQINKEKTKETKEKIKITKKKNQGKNK